MGLNLPSLDAAIHGTRPNAKPVRRQTLKGRKDRAEAKVEKAVRAACVTRDGTCRYNCGWAFAKPGDPMPMHPLTHADQCSGPSEWAHMHTRRRSKTRGRAPEYRHATTHSLMLCRAHHDEYDAKRLIITALTRKGADGPLKFRRAK